MTVEDQRVFKRAVAVPIDPQILPEYVLNKNGSVCEWNRDRRGDKEHLPHIKKERPQQGMTAALVNNIWCWVYCCPDCLGTSDDSWGFDKCEKHDFCVTCGTERKKLTETPWGHRKGFMCVPCEKKQKERLLREQMEKRANMSDHDFEYNSEILCPHCGSKQYDGDGIGNQSAELECDLCEKKFRMEPDFSVTYSTYKIEKENDDDIKNTV